MSGEEKQSVINTKTANTETIASNLKSEEERDEKILKAKNLYAQGTRKFLVKSYAAAADELSQVCTIYEEIYGAKSDELGMPYLLYAKSLIALALDDNNVVDVTNGPADDDDSDVNDEVRDADANTDENADIDAEEKHQGHTDLDEKKKEEKGENNGTNDRKPINNNVKIKEIVRNHEATIDSTETMKKIDENCNKSASNTKRTGENEVSSTGDNDGNKKSLTNGESNGNKQKMGDLNDDDEKPSTSNGESVTARNEKEQVDDDDNEAASNLQLAWEILELAAKIFQRQGESGLPNLAEVHTELANIEFENSFFEAAREDYEKALVIYKQLSKKYRRDKAEIFYKIGLSYLMQDLNKEGAASLNESSKLIEEEIEYIKSKPDLNEKDKNNIKDMEETKQEILAKITEIEETQAQNIAEVRAALDSYIKPKNKDDAGTSSTVAKVSITDTTADISSSSVKATNITHLIKRKKPDANTSEAEAADFATPAKRPAV